MRFEKGGYGGPGRPKGKRLEWDSKRKVFVSRYVATLLGISQSRASRLFSVVGYDAEYIRQFIEKHGYRKPEKGRAEVHDKSL